MNADHAQVSAKRRQSLASAAAFAFALVTCATPSRAADEATDAASGGGYSLRAPRIAGGAGNASGGALAMTATVGQHDAQLVPAQGGAYSATGGFYPAVSSNPVGPGDTIFGNGFE